LKFIFIFVKIWKRKPLCHVPRRKSIFIMFMSLQFSLRILSLDKNFVCTTLQAINKDQLILTRFVLYYFWKKLWFFYCLSVRVPRYMWILKTLIIFLIRFIKFRKKSSSINEELYFWKQFGNLNFSKIFNFVRFTAFGP
jgi:hypothetical protein